MMQNGHFISLLVIKFKNLYTILKMGCIYLRTVSFYNSSPAYYSHLLMKKRGISFRKLLTQTRIKEAKRLLAQTELSIKEIAHQTGFRTSHYFIRVFKEEMKRTPTEYRDEQRKEPQ